VAAPLAALLYNLLFFHEKEEKYESAAIPMKQQTENGEA